LGLFANQVPEIEPLTVQSLDEIPSQAMATPYSLADQLNIQMLNVN